MKQYLMKKFALSDSGAAGLIKAVAWSFVCNVSLMLPVFLIMAFIMKANELLTEGRGLAEMWPVYPLIALVLWAVLWVLHYFEYAALYITVYSESTHRRVDLAERLRKLPLSFFGKKDLSDLTSTLISDAAMLEQMFSHYIPQAFATTFSVTLISILLLVFNWRMGLATVWPIPFALALIFGSKKLQNLAGRKSIEKKIAVSDKVQEGIERIQDIKAFDLTEKYTDELEDLVEDNIRGQLRAELAGGTFVTTGKTFIRLGIASVVITGVYLMAQGELSFLYFLGYMFAAARMYDPVELMMEEISILFFAGLKIERVRNIQQEILQTGRTDFAPDNYDIQFENVSFSYDDGNEVINDLSFTAKQGQVTALVGASGSGKSTAAKLSARFWDVTSGRITLGGCDISGIDPETLLGYYSIVFQDVVLFNDTVMENIRIGRKGATDEEVINAARLAQCDEFVSELQDGYHTMIGENGARLSGGERQRISIARAILKDAPVVLLDEATASLDAESETQVQKALSTLVRGKTVIIIAHRMRTVANADHVIVLDKGVMLEEGTPERLMKQNGTFAKMVNSQMRASEWKM